MARNCPPTGNYDKVIREREINERLVPRDAVHALTLMAEH